MKPDIISATNIARTPLLNFTLGVTAQYFRLIGDYIRLTIDYLRVTAVLVSPHGFVII